MNAPNIEQTEREIREECNAIAEFLIAKNRAYGDSALNPKRFFAKGEAEELIRSRIDDKLNRIFQGKPDGEDPLKDLTGYYILLQIAKKRAIAKFKAAERELGIKARHEQVLKDGPEEEDIPEEIFPPKLPKDYSNAPDSDKMVSKDGPYIGTVGPIPKVNPAAAYLDGPEYPRDDGSIPTDLAERIIASHARTREG